LALVIPSWIPWHKSLFWQNSSILSTFLSLCFLHHSSASLSRFFVGVPNSLIVVFNVIRQVRNFFLSPMTVALETMSFSSYLMLSSIGTGGMFSPPAVIISSFSLPVIHRYPSLSIFPTSPVRNHPS